MTVKTGNAETDQLFVELAACGFDIANDKIAIEAFANGNSDRTELAYIIAKQKRENAEQTAHQKAKTAKEKRIANYAAQWAANPESELEYDADDMRLNNSQIAFVGAAVRAGWIDETELREELF